MLTVGELKHVLEFNRKGQSDHHKVSSVVWNSNKTQFALAKLSFLQRSLNYCLLFSSNEII
jgi:hypothetical protein